MTKQSINIGDLRRIQVATALVHLFTYACVCAFLVAIWTVTSGSPDRLGEILADPAEALRPGFWPIWPILAWGTAVLLHLAAGFVALLVTPASRGSRRSEGPSRYGREASSTGGRPASGAGDGTRTERATRGRVVVAFTDMVDSTRIAETLGDDVWAGVVSEHRALVRELLGRHSGREIGTQGDGFLVAFDDARAAVAFSEELQRRLRDTRASGRFAPQVRVAIHSGEATDLEDDLVGTTVNVAARVLEAAGAGEILLTEPVAEALGPTRRCDDRGLVELKGLSQRRHLLALRWDTIADGSSEPVR
ncbi:MAG: hypothetical protein KatS3mg008_2005 [Acidimicrobiales bacterium]|nr:MAG: hypothetical protein KatS3mg008_2005 [Acidimicrobiales bacterium]